MKKPYLLIITAILYLVVTGGMSLANDSDAETIESCKQAIRIDPDYADAHGSLGNVYYILSKYKEAIEAFKQAIRIFPDYATTHYNLGNAYGKLSMFKEAIEPYKQAIRINPDYASAHCYLGIAYLGLNDRGSALEQYKILKTLGSKLANMLFNEIYK